MNEASSRCFPGTQRSLRDQVEDELFRTTTATALCPVFALKTLIPCIKASRFFQLLLSILTTYLLSFDCWSYGSCYAYGF